MDFASLHELLRSTYQEMMPLCGEMTGIATEENLTKIKAKGYNYLCVSRTRLKEYTLREDHKSVIVQDSSKREVKLREVHTAPDEDYFLEITAPRKR